MMNEMLSKNMSDVSNDCYKFQGCFMMIDGLIQIKGTAFFL